MGIKSIITEEIQNFNSNFKNWFGNSKVVDEQGNPLICYHGTSKGSFTEFQPKIGYKGKSKQQVDLGSHFSADKEYASGYAGDKKDSKVFECYLRIENPLYTNQMFWREDDEQAFNTMLDFITNTFKKHANINGDNYYDKRGNKQNDVQNVMLNNFLVDKIPSNQLYTAILEHGFDGIFHEPYNMENLTQFKKHPQAYIVLNPNQIKSINNQGQWSTDDDDILNEVIDLLEGAAIGDNSGYMQMVDIVAEEIQNIDDGVGDKYAQKQFGIPDSGEKFEKQWQRHQSTDDNQENGKLVANLNYDDEYGENSVIDIYLNPKTLKNFDADVKAITDKDGNLYVAQYDAGIFHESMGYALKENGIDIGHAYNVDNNATWHRLGNSNEFGFSISFVEHFFIFDNEGRYDRIEPEHQEKVKQTVEIAKRKNPQFEFLPMYWSFYKKKDGLKF